MLAEDHLQHLADLVDKVDELEGNLKAQGAVVEAAWRFFKGGGKRPLLTALYDLRDKHEKRNSV